jgi:hypothetical protein
MEETKFQKLRALQSLSKNLSTGNQLSFSENWENFSLHLGQNFFLFGYKEEFRTLVFSKRQRTFHNSLSLLSSRILPD